MSLPKKKAEQVQKQETHNTKCTPIIVCSLTFLKYKE
jgi:hypothetical protein